MFKSVHNPSRAPRLFPVCFCLGWIAAALMMMPACTERVSSTTPTAVNASPKLQHLSHDAGSGSIDNHLTTTESDDKGYIDGWFDGSTVQLYYTKSFFCAEPPLSGASDSDCVIGADPEVPPRPGPIPTIYAIAAVGGIQPDPSTVACAAGSGCLNHPAHIDLSRVGGPPDARPVPHSHIVTERRAGWFNTVNIRVSNIDVWNQIASAKSLAKVRELQADPAIGGKGLISQDTPTNIFFFIASWRQ